MTFPTLHTHKNFILWAVGIVYLASLEVYGLLHNSDYTFTEIVRSYVPIWARAMVLGWLAYHFLIQTKNA